MEDDIFLEAQNNKILNKFKFPNFQNSKLLCLKISNFVFRILYREFFPSFFPSSLNHLFRTFPKPVSPFSFFLFWLICSFRHRLIVTCNKLARNTLKKRERIFSCVSLLPTSVLRPYLEYKKMKQKTR